MQLNGLTTKLTSKADIIGALAGVTATPGGLSDTISSIQQLIAGVLHAPDLSTIQSALQSNTTKTALYAYIAGWLIDEIKPPIVGKYGKALQKGALGFEAGYLANWLFYSMTHSEIKGVNIQNGQKSFMEQAPIMAQRYY